MQKSDLKSHTKLAMSNECGSEQDLLHNLPNIKTKKKSLKWIGYLKTKPTRKVLKHLPIIIYHLWTEKKLKWVWNHFYMEEKSNDFAK
jgi:hypothetical protein